MRLFCFYSKHYALYHRNIYRIRDCYSLFYLVKIRRVCKLRKYFRNFCCHLILIEIPSQIIRHCWHREVYFEYERRIFLWNFTKLRFYIYVYVRDKRILNIHFLPFLWNLYIKKKKILIKIIIVMQTRKCKYNRVERSCIDAIDFM